jgi:hypothetical protein
MNAFSWTCPYCGQPTTITGPNYTYDYKQIGTSQSKYASRGMSWRAIACPNPSCKNLSLVVRLHRYGLPAGQDSGQYALREELLNWELMPRSGAKPWPDYSPSDIRKTYEEACLILKDSPRASAAMSRRCLQGIARDYWKIPEAQRGNLGAELSLIRDKVDEGTWDAIQAVRSVGDIGAHMEKDVNLIIDVQPQEAKLLVELIETLFEDWYVERYKRGTRNEKLKSLAKDKLQEKKDGKKALKMMGAADAAEDESETLDQTNS